MTGAGLDRAGFGEVGLGPKQGSQDSANFGSCLPNPGGRQANSGRISSQVRLEVRSALTIFLGDFDKVSTASTNFAHA